MTAPTTDTTRVRWRGKGWRRRRKDSLQTSWRADHTPWNNPLMKDITCNSQEPVWNAASQRAGTTVRGAGDLKGDQSEWLCELFACVFKSTCILFSSTTGPCCLSLTIVAWTTFLKAASCSNNLKKCFSACHIIPHHGIGFSVPCCPTLPWEMRMPLSVSNPTEGPWPVWPSRPSRSNIGMHGQKSSEMWCSSTSLFLRAMIGISCRWLYSMGTWNTAHAHLVGSGFDFFFFIKYIFICTTLMPSTGSWNLIFYLSFYLQWV